MLFQKGMKKTAGRKAGTPNVLTAQVKEAIEWVSQKIGGPERLATWVQADPENEKIFWRDIYTKLLPLQVNATHRSAMADMNHQELVEFIAKKANETGTSMKLIVDNSEQDGSA